MEGQQESTSSSLLRRLRQPADTASWSAFVHRYGPKLYRWCRERKLQEADAQDLTQQILLGLLVKLRTFQYDRAKGFRGWLRTVTKHALMDFFKNPRRMDTGTGDSAVWRQLQSLQARQDLLQRLNAEFDMEVFEEAMAQVQLQVPRHYWEAFLLIDFQAKSAAEVASQVGMTVPQVYVARHRVRKKLRQAIATLNREGEGS